MEVIVLARNKGKTTRMLQWLREAPVGDSRVMVCATEHEVKRLRHENPDIEPWRFVSPGTQTATLLGRGKVVLGVDNVEWVVERMLGWPVGAVTVTQP